MGRTSWAKPSPQDAAALVSAFPARHFGTHIDLTALVCRLASAEFHRAPSQWPRLVPWPPAYVTHLPAQVSNKSLAGNDHASNESLCRV
jgi:hypothetical protein